MLKDEIIQAMESKRYIPAELTEFVKFFNNYSKDEVLQAIDDLRKDYVIMESNKGKLILARTKGYFKGVVTGVFDDHVFVKIDKYEKDIKISKKRHDIILPKDEVLIHLAEDETLEKVITRHMNDLVGEISIKEIAPGKYDYSIIPQSKKLNIHLPLEAEQCKNLVNGHKVVYELKDSKLGVRPVIKKVIGYKDDPMVDIMAYLIEAEIPFDFSEECIREAEQVANQGITSEDLKVREDYRDRMIFTIDGDDAKDFDDAVEVYEREDGGFKIGVHIADVSHYVKENGAIDKDADERGTSLYPVYAVIPMLPQVLSNGMCSLVPHQDRLTMSFIMNIDGRGNIEDGEINLGVINSKKRFTYNEVNNIVEKEKAETIAANKEFIPMLKAMVNASKVLRDRRERNGQLDLDIPEAKIVTDQNGHPIKIEPRYRGLAEKAIEDLMVLTNEFVANTISNMSLPFMYRVHDAPDEEKLERFINMAKSSGHKVKNKKSAVHSNDVKSILDSEEDPVVRSVLASLLLRSLPKASYHPDNIGHYALALDYYMQVTSPIRRYPDLIVHRLLKKYLFEPEKFNELNFDAIYQYLYDKGISTSSQERRAEQLERDVVKMKMAEYMEDQVGQTFVGKISGFTDKGMFVQLPNLVEGYVKFEYLTDDTYVYERERLAAFGKRTNKVLKLGDSYKIRVARASKAESIIDFGPVDYKPKKSDTMKSENKKKRKKINGRKRNKKH